MSAVVKNSTSPSFQSEKEKILDEIIRLSKNENLGTSGYNYFDIFLSEIYLGTINQIRSTRYNLIGLLISIRDFMYFNLFKRKFEAEVIFYPTVQNHLDQMFPVANELLRRGVDVLFMTNKYRLFKSIKKKYKVVGLSGAKRLLGNFCIGDSFDREINFEPTILKNTDRWKTIIFSHLNFFNRLLQHSSPHVVVCGYDITYEGRLATRYFQKKKIAVCCIQHGDMSGILNSYHIADVFFAYGQRVAESLKKSDKMHHTNFLVTGAPYLDWVNTGGYRQMQNVPSLLRQSKDLSYILVAFSGPGNSTSLQHHISLIESVYKLSQTIADAIVVFKLHPKDNIDYYESVGKKFSTNRVFIPGKEILKSKPSIFEWLHDCDVLITGGSATAVESMLCNVPVVSIDLMNEFQNSGFIEAKASVHVTNQSSLEAGVQKLLKDKLYRSSVIEGANSYIEGYFYHRDGLSSSRCADKIMERINEAKKCVA